MFFTSDAELPLMCWLDHRPCCSGERVFESPAQAWKPYRSPSQQPGAARPPVPLPAAPGCFRTTWEPRCSPQRDTEGESWNSVRLLAYVPHLPSLRPSAVLAGVRPGPLAWLEPTPGACCLLTSFFSFRPLQMEDCISTSTPSFFSDVISHRISFL